MTPLEADRILRDWVAARDELRDAELQAVANALFLEETFGVSLSDVDIDPSVIGSVSGMRAVIARHLG